MIGVARDIKYSRVTEGPRPYVYVPFLQQYQPSMMLHVRGSAAGDTLTTQVRAEIRRLDPDWPIRE